MIRFTKETIAFWKKLLEYKERLFKFLDDYPRVSEKVDGIVGDNRTIRVANPFRGGVVISGAANPRGGTGSDGPGTITPLKTLSPGSTTTAAVDTFDLLTDAKAVTLDVTTREYYDTTGHVLYYFTRLMTWDSKGKLRSISAETRHTTDSAEEGDCP